MPKRVGGLRGQKEYAEKLISEGKSLNEVVDLTGLKRNTIMHYKTELNKRKRPYRTSKLSEKWKEKFRIEWNRERKRVKELYGYQ